MSDSSVQTSSDEEVIQLIKMKNKPEKVHTTTTSEVQSPVSEEPISVSDVEEEEKEILTILKHRVSCGKIQYLVQYKNDEKEWVEEDQVLKFPDLIADYIGEDTPPPAKIKPKKDYKKDEFRIKNGYKEGKKVVYQIQFSDGEEAFVDSNKLMKHEPIKLIKFLEKYCLNHDLVTTL